jgi:hypothetical protein
MAEDPRNAELVAWLKSQGHSPAQIQQIQQRLAEYDDHTVRDSIFDSIDSGNMDLAKIVREALEQSEQAPGSGNAEE